MLQCSLVAYPYRGIVALKARSRGVVAISIQVVYLLVFDGTPSKISGFIMACKLYIRMKMRKAVVEEQIQWVLSYIQEGSADV